MGYDVDCGGIPHFYRKVAQNVMDNDRKWMFNCGVCGYCGGVWR